MGGVQLVLDVRGRDEAVVIDRNLVEAHAPSSTEPLATHAPSEAADVRLRRIVATHFDPLWLFVRRLGVLPMDLDDAIQEVIVVVAARLADIEPAKEKSFLFSTAFRVASEWRRRRGSRREVSEEELVDYEDPKPEPDALSDQARARALLDAVLAEIPTDMRAVFVLYEIEEMTMAEIAELLDLAHGTVASRLRRAREIFDARVERIQARMRRSEEGTR